MALIGNQSVLNKSHAFFTNGTAAAGAYVANTQSNFVKPSVLRSRFINVDSKTSVPDGYNLGEAYIGPQKAGGLSSGTRIEAAASLLATAISARLSSATLPGVGSTLASLSVITPGAANLNGAATISASLQSVANMSAALNGAATISGNLSAIVPLASILSGAASVSANLKGRGSLACVIDIGVSDPLSPLGLSIELLDNQDIETGYSMRESLRLILSSLVGKLSGAETTTVTIRDVNDTIDRIVATVDANGNRTTVNKDVS